MRMYVCMYVYMYVCIFIYMRYVYIQNFEEVTVAPAAVGSTAHLCFQAPTQGQWHVETDKVLFMLLFAVDSTAHLC
jgi:hypothetical protein